MVVLDEKLPLAEEEQAQSVAEEEKADLEKPVEQLPVVDEKPAEEAQVYEEVVKVDMEAVEAGGIPGEVEKPENKLFEDKEDALDSPVTLFRGKVELELQKVR